MGVAEGGMARVWAAKQHGQRGFSKVVAIKTILPALASDDSFEAMFLDEARLAACIHHPNVCEIFDLGEESGVLYLAMEWVNGESVARLLKPPRSDGQKPTPERLNPRVAARIIADAAAGLHAAHELTDEFGERRNVVHRDVSPQNILVSVNGNVKVTDFGVAKALGGSQEATMAGQIKGKTAYMSPEQASGGRIDRRSDIFALGICLYEITTGVRPFTGEGQVAVLKAVLDCEFEKPSDLVPGYPRDLEAIVLRAMAKDPMQRYPSADRMRVAIEEWLARSGPIVTETQVAQTLRDRLGALVDKRNVVLRDRMRDAGASPEPQQSFEPQREGSSSKISNPSASAIRSVTPESEGSISQVSAAGISQISSAGVSQPSVTSQPSVVSQVSQPSAVSYPSAPSGLYAPAPMPQPDTTARGALIGIGIGVGVFALLATGASFYLRGQAAEAAPAPTVPTVATTTAKSPEAPPPTATGANVENQSPVIKLVTMMPKAGITFLLDGKPLAGLEVPRPKSGEVKLLKASAEGYHDEVLRLDEFTPDQLDVLLAKADEPKPEPKTEAKVAEAPPGKLSEAPTKVEAPKETKPKKPPKPDIPDNPF